jgi:hypothetical protein
MYAITLRYKDSVHVCLAAEIDISSWIGELWEALEHEAEVVPSLENGREAFLEANEDLVHDAGVKLAQNDARPAPIVHKG